MTLAPKVAVDWKPRLAREEDIPALEALIPVSRSMEKYSDLTS